MEAKLMLRSNASLARWQIRYKNIDRRHCPVIHSPVTIDEIEQPVNNQDSSTSLSSPLSSSSESSSNSVYEDNWVDHTAKNHVSTSMQASEATTAKLILQFKKSFMKPQIHYKNIHRRHRATIHGPVTVGVMAEPVNNHDLSSSSSSSSSKFSSKSVYKDNWFDLLAINHLSTSIQATTGLKSKNSGYDGLVEAARAVHKVFNPIQQQQIVLQTLDKAFPSYILTFIRMVLPKSSKFTREYFAAFTTVFFAWLVGPCEVRESDFEGRREKNVVYIKKCRFLEESNCVGMCTNLCKSPSQIFVKNSFGMPFYMVPNFEDMSCEMIYGQEPPQQADDPAFKQPCYKLCKETKKHHEGCTP